MKGAATKEKIIQHSAELFNVYGYHGCSLTHIMDATKLKKGGIYNHFKNKDEIALEAFNYNYKRLLKRFKDRLAEDTTCFQKLNSLIDVFVSIYDDPMVMGGGCPVFNTAMDAANTHPLLKAKAQEGVNGLQCYIEMKLKEGIEAREFVEDINISQMATLFIATLEGALVISRVKDSRESIDIAADYLKNYISEKLLRK
ncbi:TetR/AcrR family transcriptional regulator [Fulvivirga sediminis]|uniref:TetR/AcrR family transcriptional regulator n=1 Tax=Fulvivirga sediminis TaxID=2803949 RepID=A0A937F9P9_9BACT|nr:TetR/AcrR family transcriptional regulator [Fulvivirga sediminis]MBL3656508.1 TetR/AcrR family transcriptional regulator [Fulvivirga sediminis]